MLKSQPKPRKKRACAFCRRSHRKCDKALPTCGQCTSSGLPCFYLVVETPPSNPTTLSPIPPAPLPSAPTSSSLPSSTLPTPAPPSSSLGDHASALPSSVPALPPTPSPSPPLSSPSPHQRDADSDGPETLAMDEEDLTFENVGFVGEQPSKKAKTSPTLQFCTLKEQQNFLECLSNLSLKFKTKLTPARVLAARKEACDLSRLSSYVEDQNQPATLWHLPFQKTGRKVTCHRRKKELVYNDPIVSLLYDSQDPTSTIFSRATNRTRSEFIQHLSPLIYSRNLVLSETVFPYTVHHSQNGWLDLECHLTAFYEHTGVARYLVVRLIEPSIPQSLSPTIPPPPANCSTQPPYFPLCPPSPPSGAPIFTEPVFPLPNSPSHSPLESPPRSPPISSITQMDYPLFSSSSRPAQSHIHNPVPSTSFTFHSIYPSTTTYSQDIFETSLLPLPKIAPNKSDETEEPVPTPFSFLPSLSFPPSPSLGERPSPFLPEDGSFLPDPLSFSGGFYG